MQCLPRRHTHGSARPNSSSNRRRLLGHHRSKCNHMSSSAEWDPFPTSITTYGGYTRFLGRDPDLKASLYWGESLLANYRILLGLKLEWEKKSFSKQEITSLSPTPTWTSQTLLSSRLRGEASSSTPGKMIR
jgi:hypothetical protein